MPFTVALFHTRMRTVDMLGRELSVHLPNVYRFNILDETIFAETVQRGLTPRVLSCMVHHFQRAEQMKAHVILNTSTIVEPAIPTCRKFVSIPILRINEPMCEQALIEGHRVCVLGSLDQTIECVADLLQEVAARRGHEVQILKKCVPKAVEQLDMGDWDAHNRLVVGAVHDLADRCDAIILAQLSLQPLLPALKQETDVPVFGSAESIVAKLTAMARDRHPTPLPDKTTKIPAQPHATQM